MSDLTIWDFVAVFIGAAIVVMAVHQWRRWHD